MRLKIVLALAILSCSALAQSPDMTSSGFILALPTHGRLHLEAPTFQIVEASAKATGTEFGLRGDDKLASVGLLVFLFRYPEEAPLTGEKCRDAILRHLKQDDPRMELESERVITRLTIPLAIAQYSVGQRHMVRAFAASEDLCADIEFSSQRSISPELSIIGKALASVTFDPHDEPSFREVFYYAQVLFDHKMMKAAAPIFEQSLGLLPPQPANEKWRRIATDQAVMAYGISGDNGKARQLLNRAIELDSQYPLNYYNLACTDAEEGNAKEAQIHLQQAFDRKKNMIPGEPFPDPTQDDSIQKLKNDKQFWAFVKSLR
jgi:tetratricopeptide (TPR) repeat protein